MLFGAYAHTIAQQLSTRLRSFKFFVHVNFYDSYYLHLPGISMCSQIRGLESPSSSHLISYLCTSGASLESLDVKFKEKGYRLYLPRRFLRLRLARSLATRIFRRCLHGFHHDSAKKLLAKLSKYFICQVSSGFLISLELENFKSGIQLSYVYDSYGLILIHNCIFFLVDTKRYRLSSRLIDRSLFSSFHACS